MIKVLLVDDESGMRVLLRKIIEKVDGYEVVGECKDGNEALICFMEKRPDVVFLDVEMPDLNGVDCAKSIVSIEPKTKIIFATAFLNYMDKAFEVYAFDYLVKPFKVDRVFKTLEKIKSLSSEEKKKNGIDKLLVKNREGINVISKEDICLVKREDNQTIIYTVKQKIITSQGLADIELNLGKEYFFRAHKSYIVNLNAITNIDPYGRWTYIVTIKGIKEKALMTQNKYQEFKNEFNL